MVKGDIHVTYTMAKVDIHMVKGDIHIMVKGDTQRVVKG